MSDAPLGPRRQQGAGSSRGRKHPKTETPSASARIRLPAYDDVIAAAAATATPPPPRRRLRDADNGGTGQRHQRQQPPRTSAPVAAQLDALDVAADLTIQLDALDVAADLTSAARRRRRTPNRAFDGSCSDDDDGDAALFAAALLATPRSSAAAADDDDAASASTAQSRCRRRVHLDLLESAAKATRNRHLGTGPVRLDPGCYYRDPAGRTGYDGTPKTPSRELLRSTNASRRMRTSRLHGRTVRFDFDEEAEGGHGNHGGTTNATGQRQRQHHPQARRLVRRQATPYHRRPTTATNSAVNASMDETVDLLRVDLPPDHVVGARGGGARTSSPLRCPSYARRKKHLGHSAATTTTPKRGAAATTAELVDGRRERRGRVNPVSLTLLRVSCDIDDDQDNMNNDNDVNKDGGDYRGGDDNNNNGIGNLHDGVGGLGCSGEENDNHWQRQRLHHHHHHEDAAIAIAIAKDGKRSSQTLAPRRLAPRNSKAVSRTPPPKEPLANVGSNVVPPAHARRPRALRPGPEAAAAKAAEKARLAEAAGTAAPAPPVRGIASAGNRNISSISRSFR